MHDLISRETGGDAGVRDFGLLESALESAYQTFDGKELYPTILQKAVRLCYGLVQNHPFYDGNKRIGTLALLVTLDLNNITFSADNPGLTDIILSLADSRISDQELLEWVADHCQE